MYLWHEGVDSKMRVLVLAVEKKGVESETHIGAEGQSGGLSELSLGVHKKRQLVENCVRFWRVLKRVSELTE